jgi:hypothetical protein
MVFEYIECIMLENVQWHGPFHECYNGNARRDSCVYSLKENKNE